MGQDVGVRSSIGYRRRGWRLWHKTSLHLDKLIIPYQGTYALGTIAAQIVLRQRPDGCARPHVRPWGEYRLWEINFIVCSGPPCACASGQAGRARLGETRAGQARHARFTEVQGLRGDMPSSRAGPTHPTGTWRNRGEECRNMLVWASGEGPRPMVRAGLAALGLTRRSACGYETR